MKTVEKILLDFVDDCLDEYGRSEDTNDFYGNIGVCIDQKCSEIKEIVIPSIEELENMIDKFAQQKNKAELIFGDEFKDLATAIRKLIESRVR